MLARLAHFPSIGFLGLGALLALGHAPISLFYVGFGALIAMQFLWLHIPSLRKPKNVFWFGSGYFLVTMNWLIEPFLVDIVRTGWMGPFAVVAMASGMAFLWSLPVRLFPRSPVTFTFAVAFSELIRGYIFTGFPWGQVAYIWVDTPVAPWVAFVGSYGLSAITLVAASITAWGLVNLRRMLVTPIGLVALCMPSYFYAPDLEQSGQTVRVVQPNATQDKKWDPEYSMIFFQRALDYTGRSGDVDLVIWPESSVPVFLNYAEELMSDIALFAQGKPVLVGALRFEEYEYFNSVILVDKDGEYSAVYDKSHLVPFGEYLPFPEFFERFGMSALADIVGGGFNVGSGPSLVPVDGFGDVLPLICYEAVFPQDIKAAQFGAGVIVQMTNDGWFGNFSGPAQHLAQTQMRAIEQGVPLIRSANTGISAVIDPLGNVIEKTALNEQGFIDVPLPKPLPATVYATWGERSVILILSILFILCLITSNGALGLTRHA